MSASVTPDQESITPHDLAVRAGNLASEKLAHDVVVMDLRDVSPVCDWFVIATADSEPQVRAVADHIEEGLRSLGEKPWHVEGREGKHWILMDYVHFVVHVFLPETREVYMLERLWGDAPREEVTGGTGDS